MRRTLGWMLMLVVLTLLGGACASSGGQKPPARLRARLPTPWPDTLYGGIPEARFAKALQRPRTWRYDSTHPALIVDPQTQRMVYVAPGPTPTPKRWFAISTSRYGFSNQAGLACTPPGVHRIKERYGAGAPIGMSFRGRVATDTVVTIYTDTTDVPEDLVTTRILWLAGQEPGTNQGPGVDSHDRYMYIHGTPEEGLLGRPASHGCIRMRNRELAAYFPVWPSGTWVEIMAGY